MRGLVPIAGVVLIVLGALGATVTQRRLEAAHRGRLVPVLLVPYGVLMGGGAAFVRGWDLALSMLIGGVFVPLVGVVGRLIDVRRRKD